MKNRFNSPNKRFLNKIKFLALTRQKSKVIITWFTLFISSTLVLFSLAFPSITSNYEKNVLQNNGPFKSNIQYNANPSNNLMFHYDSNTVVGSASDDEWGGFGGQVYTTNYNGTFDPYDVQTMMNSMIPLSDLPKSPVQAINTFERLMAPIDYLGGVLFNAEWLEQLKSISTSSPIIQLKAVRQIVCPLLGVPKEVWTPDTQKDGSNTTIITCINYMLSETLPLYMKQKIFGSGPIDPTHIYDFTLASGLNAYTPFKEELYTYADGNIAGSKINQQVWGLRPDTEIGIKNFGGLANYLAVNPNAIPTIVNSTFARVNHLKNKDTFTYQAKIPYIYVKADSTGAPDVNGKWIKMNPNRIYLHSNSGLATYYCKNGDSTRNHMDCSDDNNQASATIWQPNIVSLTELYGRNLLKVDYETVSKTMQVDGITQDYSNPKILTLRNYVNDMYGYQNFNPNTKTIGGDVYGGFNAKLSMLETPKDLNTFGLNQTFFDFTVWGLNGFNTDSDDPSNWWNPVTPNTTGGGGDWRCGSPQMEGRCIKRLPNAMSLNITSLDYGQLKKESLDKVIAIISTLSSLMMGIGVTISFVIIAVTTNIIVLDNKRKISNFKTLGYTEKEISNITISVYWYVMVFAFICAIPFTIFSIYFLLNAFAKNSGISLPVYLQWWNIPLAFLIIGGAYFISYLINKKYINKFKAIDILKD